MRAPLKTALASWAPYINIIIIIIIIINTSAPYCNKELTKRNPTHPIITNNQCQGIKAKAINITYGSVEKLPYLCRDT